VLTLTDGQGKRVQLAAEIGRGGEAVVYNVRGHDKLVAKLYLPGKQDEGAKISSMLAIADPRLQSLGAWPTDTLRDGGKIAGFLMPKITGHRSLFDLTVPKLRLREFPKADWRFLIRTAENTARAFHFIHQAGVVIGDVNHSNLLVANDATIRCIDCDSFQITANAQHWLCRVGTGDYQPPEMQGLASYQGIVRTPNHDNFGLAVIIFRLLFAGRHPFSGRWQGQGDAPSIEEAIKACRYVYSQRRKTGFQPPGSALSVDVLPDKVGDMFERAFDPRASNGGRPTAEQWMVALQALGRTVRQCRSNRWHWFYTGATTCPWCEIEQSGAVLFGATVAPQSVASQPSVSASIPSPPSQAPQVAHQPPPAPPTTPVLLSRQTAVRLFAWVRARRKAIAWVSAVTLVVWLASRQDTTPPPQPASHAVTVPVSPVRAMPAPAASAPSTPPTPAPLPSPPANKPSSPSPASPSPPAPRSVEAATPTPVPQVRPSPLPAYQPPPPALPPASVPIPQLPPIPVAPAPPSAAALPLPTQPWTPPPQPAVQSPPMTIGPSFDCGKTKTPLQNLICSDPALSRVDVEMVQPYYVLRQIVGKDGWQDLLYEAIGFSDQTAYDCRISDAGELPPDQAKLKTCLLQAYKAQRSVWLQKLEGAGREEAERPIEQHIALQARLQAMGYLPATARIDGVYGTATRAAIAAWQTAAQLPVTGLLGDDLALLGVNVPTATRSAPSSEPASRPAPLLSGPQVGQPATAFDQGLADRKGWETWFNALSSDYHEGARYWSAQRSLPKPGSCFGPGGQSLGDWTAGCIAAQQRLAPTDARRKSEPEYRQGWNSY
jgi:serine/threonine protein kinase